jgi:DNA ligase-1
MLGALVVEYESMTFKIGTGFDDKLRKEVWENRDKYLGKLVKFKYQEIGVKDLPRFPSYLEFIGYRDEDDL